MLRRDIFQGRQLSRAAGFSRLRAEFAGIGFEFSSRTGVIDVFEDAQRAKRAAAGYVARWLRAGGEDSPRIANRDSIGSLRRIAATESSQAFNAERAEELRTRGLHELVRVWDAALDKRTCPRCSAADGTIVGARESFPLGEPGAVHPWCRCGFTLMTLRETHHQAA